MFFTQFLPARLFIRDHVSLSLLGIYLSLVYNCYRGGRARGRPPLRGGRGGRGRGPRGGRGRGAAAAAGAAAILQQQQLQQQQQQLQPAAQQPPPQPAAQQPLPPGQAPPQPAGQQPPPQALPPGQQAQGAAAPPPPLPGAGGNAQGGANAALGAGAAGGAGAQGQAAFFPPPGFFNAPPNLHQHFGLQPGAGNMLPNVAFNPYVQGLPPFIPPPPGAGLLGPVPGALPVGQQQQQQQVDNRDALLQLARQLGGEQSSEEDDDEADEGDGGPSEFERQVERYRSLATVNPAQSFLAAASRSNVMGPEYLRSSVVDASREQEIRDAENQMTSQDKKRQMRILQSFRFLHEDLHRLIAAGPGMLSVGDLDADRRSLGDDAFAANWDASRKTIRESIDTFKAAINREISLLRLANDKGNKFGFATIERMKNLEQLKKSLSKEDWDRFLRASTSMNQIRGKPKRGGGGGGGGRAKRRKPNGNQQPRFPKCAVCNKPGHVAGDAACKAAAK